MAAAARMVAAARGGGQRRLSHAARRVIVTSMCGAIVCVLLGRGLHSLPSKLNLRTFGITSLPLELNLSTFGPRPRFDLGCAGNEVILS
jgi:hypothetical protein